MGTFVLIATQCNPENRNSFTQQFTLIDTFFSIRTQVNFFILCNLLAFLHFETGPNSNSVFNKVNQATFKSIMLMTSA